MSGRQPFAALRAQTPERQARVAEVERQMRTALHLRDLRRQLHLTQKDVAQRMDVSQRNVSKLEQGGDPRVSSLQRYVSAMGGTIRIVVTLPNEEPIDLLTSHQEQPHHPRRGAPAAAQ